MIVTCITIEVVSLGGGWYLIRRIKSYRYIAL